MKMPTASLRCFVPLSFIVCFLLINWCTPAFGSVGCLDNNGHPVDWFIVYLLPNHSGHMYDQMYMDVSNQAWVKSGSIKNTRHAIYNTLQQIYSHYEKKDLAYVMYNDGIPFDNDYEFKYGHNKGDVAFDQQSGFWLVHSLPKFPPRAKYGYGFDTNVGKYGQIFLCISFSYSSFDTIGIQLRYMYPHIYDYQLPETFSGNKNMASAMLGEHVGREADPWTNNVTILSLAGQAFTSFAKYSSQTSYGYDKDLYDAYVAPTLESSLLAQTWLNDPNPLPSCCNSHYTVENVKKLEVNGETFEAKMDHSKWAVSVDGNWICIGDINRDMRQKDRSGGTVCSELPQVAAAFRKVVKATYSCSGSHHIHDEV